MVACQTVAGSKFPVFSLLSPGLGPDGSCQGQTDASKERVEFIGHMVPRHASQRDVTSVTLSPAHALRDTVWNVFDGLNLNGILSW